ncbi:MAG: nitroreductase family deazaflavin-dependent oxidoreductase [Actinomycetia bacterium]|nr:nitroreductase family deazaflavin-dependent oxidoreductase [Actinomycetes bacterium]
MAQTKINKSVMRILAGLHGRLYKLTGGRLGAKMQDGNIILLGTTGRKSGQHRERPLIAGDHPDGWVVIASYSGHDEHPAWYLNLMANPAATVQLGSESHPITARETSGDERQKLWDEMVSIYTDYAGYEAVTDREIPVLVLERSSN